MALELGIKIAFFEYDERLFKFLLDMLELLILQEFKRILDPNIILN